MSGEIAVRLARPEDADAIADIHVKGYQEAYRGLIPDEVIDGRPPEVRRRVWTERLSASRPREFVVVAELDGAVAGFASGRPAAPEEDDDPENVGCWENLYLNPEHLGSATSFRLGRELHGATLREARERGFQEMVAFVIEGNHRGRRFFESQGWLPDGGERHTEGIRSDRLRRSLEP